MRLILMGIFIATRVVLADVPMGHPDYYPSSERPMGWRGDRTGAFPGAAPVTEWDSKVGKNIAWKCRLPAPSWSQPIVVGEKVFTTADPNLLICVNVHNGKILWQKEVDHTTLMSPEKAKQAKAELAYFDSLFPLYVDSLRAMEKMQALAKTNGFNAEELKNAVLKMGSVDSIYPETKNYKNADVEKALTNPEIKALFDPLVKLRKEYAFNFKDPRPGNNWSAIESDYRNTIAGKPFNLRMDKLITEFDIWPWPRQNWYGCCTMTFATPCSDGRYVYVAFPNNQVACYDLDGVRKWMIWDHPPANQPETGLFHTRFIPSPLLVGDNLVVNQNGDLRVLDKKTGRRVWGVWDPYMKSRNKRDKTIGSRDYRPYPEGCSPVLVRLPVQGKPVEFIADGGGNLYRMTDGKVVCTNMPVSSKGQSPVTVYDLYVWKSGSDSSVWPIGVCRLKAISDDVVECEALWKTNAKSKGQCSPIVYNGAVYTGDQTFELLTGKELPTTRLGQSDVSPIIAGDWIVARGGAVGPVNKEGKAISNVLQDDITSVDPEWERKVYCGQCGTFGNCSWYAAGNRLFYRTAGYLWCIGNPQQPFQASANCPPQAKVNP